MTTQKDQSKRSGRIVVCLFVASVIGLLWVNMKTFISRRHAEQNQKRLTESRELEKSNLEKLNSLELAFKRQATEYRLMNGGVKDLYMKQCHQLEDFVPLFKDRIITVVFYYSTNERGITFFYTPETGTHQLRVEAVIPPKTRKGDEYYLLRKTIPLEPGRSYRADIDLADSQDTVKVSLSGNESVDIKFPSGTVKKGSIVQISSSTAVAWSPNQISYSRGSTQRQPFARVPFSWGMEYHNKNIRDFLGSNANKMEVRLYIDSDGPITGMPDEPAVVRKLLTSYDRGIAPNFVFNEETRLYEFEPRDE